MNTLALPSRRLFLSVTPAVLLAPAGASLRGQGDAEPDRRGFPYQGRDVVREVVTASHGDFQRVKELVNARPALARASWDWGFGDHEAAIDAASHVGNRAIAEFLLANGARPTIFTAAMLGHLAVVREMIEAAPGIQRTRGPHGITLLAHARAGGSAADAVVRYLEKLGDADPQYVDLPLSASERAMLPGDYQYGDSPAERLRIAAASTRLEASIPGVMVNRMLFHQGGLLFHPAGAEAVKIRFEAEGALLTIQDGPVSVRARKIA